MKLGCGPAPSGWRAGLKTCRPVAFLLVGGAVLASGGAETPRPGAPWTVPQLALEMAWIPPGTFRLGSAESEAGHEPDERAVEVTLGSGFWLGRTEVTVAQWREFVAATGFAGKDAGRGLHVRSSRGWQLTPGLDWRDPGFPQSDEHPVVGVSWEDAAAFAAWLTTREQSAGRLPEGWAYGLPSEAQWEYACRAGTRTAYSFGDTLAPEQANFGAGGRDGRYPEGTRRVASHPANAWGLHDMHGNVWEWCADAHGPYPEGPLRDPPPAAGGTHKVKRGGSWIGAGENCRSANRNRDQPGHRSFIIGFRVALRKNAGR